MISFFPSPIETRRLGATLLAFSLLCTAPQAHAQTQTQTQTQGQTPVALTQTGSLSGAPLPDPNGFNDLFDAVEKLVRADRLGTEAQAVPDEELIRQKRDNVSRNKRSLTSLRLALKNPVMHPPVRDADGDFGAYSGFRALAVLLDQESDVRRSNRDWVGAFATKLDCIEFGVLITRGGPLRATVAGRDIEVVGRRGIEAIVSHLTDEECAAGAARLERIESLRPPFSDGIREGKVAAIAITRDSFDTKDWDEVVKITLKLNGQPFTDDERTTLGTIGQAEVVAGIERTFTAALQGADGPYKVGRGRQDFALDPWSTYLSGVVNSPAYRVQYEAARAQNRLLALALKLRVVRAKSGAYPETFETYPDPFADPASANSKLIYRRAGETYALYSIGPNAKDDAGAPLSPPQSTISNGAVAPNASGDILAPVFPL